jgi:sensor histidine kinase regulating citrate/malate metabolism
MGDWFLGILINFVEDAQQAYDILALCGIIVSILAGMAILFYIRSHDKRTVVETELQETKREMELKQTRYGEIEKRSEELAKIRHDFNNQLAAVIHLVRFGENETAHEIISALENEINQTEK